MVNTSRRSWLSWLFGISASFFQRPLFAKGLTNDFTTSTPAAEASENMSKLMRDNFPYEIITVTGESAYAEWQRLRDLGNSYPVVIGNDESLDSVIETFDMNSSALEGATLPGLVLRTPEQIIAAADLISLPSDLKKWQRITHSEELNAPKENWPSTPMLFSNGLTVATDILNGRFYDNVHIVLIPTQISWEVPAFLQWGNWNACPPSEYHVAALKKWNELYGAELVGFSGDVLDIKIQRKPSSRNEAITLAREIYYYCPDTVDQGAGSITELAAALKNSNWWSIWWD
jgi:hypothetical protein